MLTGQSARLGKEKTRGFTIIEVMIFIAVSGLMFMTAILLFQGVQGRNQFGQSMRDIDSKFQDIINDISTGYFDELQNFSCVAGSGSSPTFTPGGGGQGTNLGCIFLGYAVLLTPGGDSGKVEINPVIGNRLKTGGRDVETFSEAHPTSVYSGAINLIKDYSILWQARVKSAAPNYAGGFYGSLARYSAGSGGSSTAIQSGAQQVEFYSHGIGANQNKDSLKACLESTACFGASPATEPWVICFESGDGRETASLSIGGSGKLSTKLEFINC